MGVGVLFRSGKCAHRHIGKALRFFGTRESWGMYCVKLLVGEVCVRAEEWVRFRCVSILCRKKKKKRDGGENNCGKDTYTLTLTTYTHMYTQVWMGSAAARVGLPACRNSTALQYTRTCTHVHTHTTYMNVLSCSKSCAVCVLCAEMTLLCNT